MTGASGAGKTDRLGELKCDSRQTELNMSLFFDVKCQTQPGNLLQVAIEHGHFMSGKTLFF